MRENRTYGSEGGEAQANASFLPLLFVTKGLVLSNPHQLDKKLYFIYLIIDPNISLNLD